MEGTGLCRWAVIGWLIVLVGPSCGRSEHAGREGDEHAASEQLARGRYLARHVTVCIDCHSERDWTRMSAPVVAGSEGGGGERFGPEVDVPGELYAPNITPYALNDWSDEEILWAMVTGVARDGRGLFPLMPYHAYSQMSLEDAESIVAFLRTLSPVEKVIPERRLEVPDEIIQTMTLPEIRNPEKTPPRGTLDYGRYLTTIAACSECHTPWLEEGVRNSEMAYAGGMEFRLPTGTVRSANITPHPETGIGNWSRELFIMRFKNLDPTQGPLPEAEAGVPVSIMPWSEYAGMTEEDLGAIFDYLKSLTAIPNQVTLFEFE